MYDPCGFASVPAAAATAACKIAFARILSSLITAAILLPPAATSVAANLLNFAVADTTYHCGCSLSLGPKCGRSQMLPHYSCEQRGPKMPDYGDCQTQLEAGDM